MNRDQFQRAAIPYSPEYTNQMYDASQEGLPMGDPNMVPLHELMSMANQEPTNEELDMREFEEQDKMRGQHPLHQMLR